MSDVGGYPGPPGGVERRRQRQTELAQAMADVVQLQESVTTLATAVGRIVPDKGRLKEALIKVGIMLGVAAVFIVVVMWFMASWVIRSVNAGHGEVTREVRTTQCLLQVPEATRVAAPKEAELTCRASEEDR